ncbi:hypothetical protein [Rhizobium pisi]
MSLMLIDAVHGAASRDGRSPRHAARLRWGFPEPRSTVQIIGTVVVAAGKRCLFTAYSGIIEITKLETLMRNRTARIFNTQAVGASAIVDYRAL